MADRKPAWTASAIAVVLAAAYCAAGFSGSRPSPGAGYLASANSLSAAIVESAGPIADALIP